MGQASLDVVDGTGDTETGGRSKASQRKAARHRRTREKKRLERERQLQEAERKRQEVERKRELELAVERRDEARAVDAYMRNAHRMELRKAVVSINYCIWQSIKDSHPSAFHGIYPRSFMELQGSSLGDLLPLIEEKSADPTLYTTLYFERRASAFIDFKKKMKLAKPVQIPWRDSPTPDEDDVDSDDAFIDGFDGY